jgi:hypothetical protein
VGGRGGRSWTDLPASDLDQAPAKGPLLAERPLCAPIKGGFRFHMTHREVTYNSLELELGWEMCATWERKGLSHSVLPNDPATYNLPMQHPRRRKWQNPRSCYTCLGVKTE